MGRPRRPCKRPGRLVSQSPDENFSTHSFQTTNHPTYGGSSEETGHVWVSKVAPMVPIVWIEQGTTKSGSLVTPSSWGFQASTGTKALHPHRIYLHWPLKPMPIHGYTWSVWGTYGFHTFSPTKTMGFLQMLL